MIDVHTANLILAIGVVLLNLGTIKMLIGLSTHGWFARIMDSWIRRFGIAFAFFSALAASVVTLCYSEILSIEPCGLCWLERVMLYPQVILFAIALYKKDTGVWIYSVALSVIGSVIALYHHYIQMGGVDLFPCPAVMDAVNCADKTFLMFGYITYPFAAFSLFIYLILIMLLVKRAHVVH